MQPAHGMQLLTELVMLAKADVHWQYVSKREQFVAVIACEKQDTLH